MGGEMLSGKYTKRSNLLAKPVREIEGEKNLGNNFLPPPAYIFVCY